MKYKIRVIKLLECLCSQGEESTMVYRARFYTMVVKLLIYDFFFARPPVREKSVFFAAQF